jgi:hypothetical protein
MSSSDYRFFSSENLEDWSLKKGPYLAKARQWPAFLGY